MAFVCLLVYKINLKTYGGTLMILSENIENDARNRQFIFFCVVILFIVWIKEYVKDLLSLGDRAILVYGQIPS